MVFFSLCFFLKNTGNTHTHTHTKTNAQQIIETMP